MGLGVGVRTEPREPTLAPSTLEAWPPPAPVPAQVSPGALMVRVGGGWVALDEHLVKNDPERSEAWGRGKTESSGPGMGTEENRPWVPTLGAKGHLLHPIHLGSLGSKGEDQPEDPRVAPVLGCGPSLPGSGPSSSAAPGVPGPGRWALGLASEKGPRSSCWTERLLRSQVEVLNPWGKAWSSLPDRLEACWGQRPHLFHGQGREATRSWRQPLRTAWPGSPRTKQQRKPPAPRRERGLDDDGDWTRGVPGSRSTPVPAAPWAPSGDEVTFVKRNSARGGRGRIYLANSVQRPSGRRGTHPAPCGRPRSFAVILGELTKGAG